MLGGKNGAYSKQCSFFTLALTKIFGHFDKIWKVVTNLGSSSNFGKRKLGLIHVLAYVLRPKYNTKHVDKSFTHWF